MYTRSDRSRASHYADEIARLAWKLRGRFFTDETPLDNALEKASRMKKGSMVISDSDSTTSGAPGDNTVVLHELVKRNVSYPALLSLVDHAVVKRALRAGVGEEISCEMGGKLDTKYCVPVRVTAQVKKITDGRFVTEGGHIGKQNVDMGKTVVLETGNISILVSEKPGPMYEQTVYTHAGLDPKKFRVVVVKSPVGFREAYETIARKIVLADCPGFSSSDLFAFKYENIPHPLYPFDEIGNHYPFSSILC